MMRASPIFPSPAWLLCLMAEWESQDELTARAQDLGAADELRTRCGLPLVSLCTHVAQVQQNHRSIRLVSCCNESDH